MSENENQPASKKTSSIPLKKETVRVTLKASDAPPAVPSATLPGTPNSDAPVKLTPAAPTKPPIVPVVPTAQAPAAPSAAPTAPKPPESPSTPAPVKPTAPGAPKPLTASAPLTGAPTSPKQPAPTIPLKTAGPMGAPTIKLATSKAPVGAPTIALKTANTPLPGSPSKTTTPAPTGAPTAPALTPPTATLPKATVALNPPTKPLTPIGAATTQNPEFTSAEVEQDESGVNTFTNIVAGVGLAAALILLGLQLSLASVWISAEDNPQTGDWMQLLE